METRGGEGKRSEDGDGRMIRVESMDEDGGIGDADEIWRRKREERKRGGSSALNRQGGGDED